MAMIKRLIKSFTYAVKGLVKIFREEQNLQIQTTIGLIVLLIAFAFNISRIEWITLVLAISLVFLLEIANSAVERISDVLKPRINHYIKEIKDISEKIKKDRVSLFIQK